MQQMLRASHQLLTPSRSAAASRLLVATRQQTVAPLRQPLQARAYTNDAAGATCDPRALTWALNDGMLPGSDEDYNDQPYPVTIFSKWAVYKGKAALNVKPVRPKWKRQDKGGWALDKEGGFTFEMANSIPNSERRYDWSKKVLIFLRPLELSQIITEPQREHTFYHDTFKNQPGREGTLVKTLKWSPAESGYFVSASLTDKTQGQEKKVSVSCSLTSAEYTVFEQLVRGCMCNMHGFDVIWEI